MNYQCIECKNFIVRWRNNSDKFARLGAFFFFSQIQYEIMPLNIFYFLQKKQPVIIN